MALVNAQLTKAYQLQPAVPLDGKSRQVWHYEAAADSVATVVAAGYFNNVRSLLQVGDRINVVAAANTAFRVLHVATVPATGNITVVALAFS